MDNSSNEIEQQSGKRYFENIKLGKSGRRENEANTQSDKLQIVPNEKNKTPIVMDMFQEVKGMCEKVDVNFTLFSL